MLSAARAGDAHASNLLSRCLRSGRILAAAAFA